MTVATAVSRVALIGNPNTGKTTLFNALTGLNQRVGNYPGVTVEMKTGKCGEDIEILDLPGTYSLAAFSPDEAVAARALIGELDGEPRPDLVVVVVDAANLNRNLYLVTQVMEIGVPVVLALNMIDLAEKAGTTVDVEKLSAGFGVPVVPTLASKRQGVDELKAVVRTGLGADAPATPWNLPSPLELEEAELHRIYPAGRFLLRRGIVDAEGSAEQALVDRFGEDVAVALTAARDRIREKTGLPPAATEARMRYTFIGQALAGVVTRRPTGPSFTDRADTILTHRLFGTAIFVVILTSMFMSIFAGAAPFMDLIDGLFQSLGEIVLGWFAGTALEGGMLESLIVDGAIAGVGGVLIFLPQIIFLFLFIAVLEDCGYLARAAFLMDRLLRFCGLSGHSFIPLLSSFACAIPGIMAARTIGDRRDRLATILVAPLMSCSARLPVYALLIAAFVPAVTVLGFLSVQGLVFAGMYFLGIVVAVAVAFLLKRTILKGPPSAFVMELPPYRVPSVRTVALRVYDRARAFVLRAGTIIFAMSVVIWALGYFPRSSEVLERHEAERQVAAATLSGENLESRLASIDSAESGELLRGSFLGSMGRGVEPLVRPLGWDWKIGMAAIAAFPAREVVVSTLSIIYDLGEEGAEEQQGLMTAMTSSKRPDGTPVFNLAVALSLMVFFALGCQCGATVATIRRELNSWGWAGFAFSYMTVLAYIGALITYQVATALGA